MAWPNPREVSQRFTGKGTTNATARLDQNNGLVIALGALALGIGLLVAPSG